jgi:uncharacterized protein YndB with AHSA1/START domain
MLMKPKGAQLTLPSDREVVVTREFQAPRGLVYEAYTTPALVKRWLLGPPGWTMPVCEMDVRVGGKFRWRWRADEGGAEFGFHGEYLEIEPDALIRNTEVYDPGDVGGSMTESGQALVTVTFDETDGVTLLTTRIEYDSKESRDAAVSTGMTDGMEMSYQLLDGLLVEEGGA